MFLPLLFQHCQERHWLVELGWGIYVTSLFIWLPASASLTWLITGGPLSNKLTFVSGTSLTTFPSFLSPWEESTIGSQVVSSVKKARLEEWLSSGFKELSLPWEAGLIHQAWLRLQVNESLTLNGNDLTWKAVQGEVGRFSCSWLSADTRTNSYLVLI